MAEASQGRSKIALVVVTLILVAAVVVGGFFQEEIGYYIALKGWDRAAPARAVSSFLEAGRAGDREKAGQYLGDPSFQPLEKGGKWVGYRLTSNAGALDFLFSKLAPPPGTPATSTEYIYRGPGAANVIMPDAAGNGVPYRLEMINGGWKIKEILGGEPAS